METQAQIVLTLGLDQITKFTKYIYRLDGPLVRVSFSGLTQGVFRLLDWIQ
jgi:hypothetical protein